MSIIFYISITPILLLVAIPLSIFAAFTTTLAFSTLFFRALVVYAELAAALIQDYLAVLDSPKEKPPSSKTITEATQSRRKSRRSSAASGSSNGGSSTPKAPDTSGFGMYSGGAARDFEGVGGWRIPGSDDEDASWTSMNSRYVLTTLTSLSNRWCTLFSSYDESHADYLRPCCRPNIPDRTILEERTDSYLV